MPRRTDIRTILIIGSGPIVIGQGCEFDYSGTQACKALREEGFQVVLVNSNPATIMTDPEFADRTYIEPITPETVEKIIAREHGGPYHIDALLPTLGGQTALNCACALYDSGVLKRYGVEMIGADRDVIYRAEDRQIFHDIIDSIGLRCPRSATATSMERAWEILEEVGLPAIIRPAFTLGGTGGGVAYNREEFEDIVRRGLDASMTHQVLIDQSVLGWKEYELEVMRDHDDNVVIICSIENFDAMGVHTGDSITIAPAQTLTDKEYQRMRDAAMAIIRAVGVETGGSNIQFAINPADGEMLVVEMNPRVSRSSALASKATGFPIAKIAAKLAVGYLLWELKNDITGQTVACFEPTIDYVVTKIPRWTFEKFPEADETLTTQMKSVGEAMSIGRTFKESLQKGIRSMEVKRFGLGLDRQDKWLAGLRATIAFLDAHHPDALRAVMRVARRELGGCTTLQAAALLHNDPVLLARLSAAARQQLSILQQSLGAGHGGFVRQAATASADLWLAELEWPITPEKLQRKLNVPSQGRLYYIRYAMKLGWSVQQVHEATFVDPWFLEQVRQLIDFEQTLIGYDHLDDVPAATLFKAKQLGYSDAQLANLYEGRISAETILHVRKHRKRLGIEPVFKLVDTCAAEFEAATPYYYSTYETPWVELVDGQPTHRADDETRLTDRPKIIILGGGPNRVGQGIEFDYCCVQAAFAADELGFESVMINSNPETVSTDYDTSDLLFFEPLTLEDVLNVYERLDGGQGRVNGMIVQFGGQTPLNLAHGLELAGVPIIGTSVDSIDLAEDRERFQKLLHGLGLKQPENGIAYSIEQAIQIANQIGYPVLVRPSFVLGGRAMETVFDDEQLRHYMQIALGASDLEDQPILIDKFLAEAIECDVDVIADFPSAAAETLAAESAPAPPAPAAPPVQQGDLPAPRALVCGVMEHIEEAGVHSGDSACAIPPFSLPAPVVEQLRDASRRLAEALGVRGLMNVQYAIKHPPAGEGAAATAGGGAEAGADGYEVFVLEVNPRASRTVPFVSKATGVSWARLAAKVMAGRRLGDLEVSDEVRIDHTAVKESVFPFSKFPGVDVILGPEMRSTGEVMGIDAAFPFAVYKSQLAAGTRLPVEGRIFLSVRDSDKPHIVAPARTLIEAGFEVITTGGTHEYLRQRGIETRRIRKIVEGRPNAIDMIKNHELALIINTPTRKGIGSDEGKLRATAVRFNVPIITTTTGAAAAVQAMTALRARPWTVQALQEYFPDTFAATARATTEGSVGL